jgi:thiol-disulfide isomerase/thioredoxin
VKVTGVLVVVAVLLVGTATGLWRRRTDGRLRRVAPRQPSTRSLGVDLAGSPTEPVADPSAQGQRIDVGLLAELGVPPAAATLLQFSSAFCSPCRAVRRISSQVAAMVAGVQHVEVDAESHLEAVRALGIWRTPTLLVLDGDGRVIRRATGVPGKAHLIAALGEILPASTR